MTTDTRADVPRHADGHRRRVRRRRRRPDLRRRRPGDRRGHRDRAAGRPADVDRAVAAAQARLRGPQGLGELGRRQARPVAGQVRGPDQGAHRGARPAREPQRRQADQRRARRGHRRQPRLRLLRRRRQQGLRPDDPGLEAGPGPDPARADRRGRADRALELPAADGLVEGRAGARRGQHGDPQAGQLLPVDGDPARRAGARGGHPARRPQRRHRPGRHRRRRDRRPSGHRQGRLHRRDDDRPGDHAAGRRQREEGLARARRQEPQHRLRRRRPREVRPRVAVLGVRQRRPGLLRAQPDPRRAVRPRARRRAVRRGDPQASRSATRRDDATEVGTLVSFKQRDRVSDYIEIGLGEGATIVVGGDAPDDPALADGAYLMPTVFDGVSNDMRIAREEIFGPVVSIIPFDTEEEALRLANATPYGLSGSIWSRDIGKALRAAKALQAGVISVNSNTSVHTEAPFGGYKMSGIGRELGMSALDLYTETKNVFIDLTDGRGDGAPRAASGAFPCLAALRRREGRGCLTRWCRELNPIIGVARDAIALSARSCVLTVVRHRPDDRWRVVSWSDPQSRTSHRSTDPGPRHVRAAAARASRGAPTSSSGTRSPTTGCPRREGDDLGRLGRRRGGPADDPGLERDRHDAASSRVYSPMISPGSTSRPVSSRSRGWPPGGRSRRPRGSRPAAPTSPSPARCRAG